MTFGLIYSKIKKLLMNNSDSFFFLTVINESFKIVNITLNIFHISNVNN